MPLQKHARRDAGRFRLVHPVVKFLVSGDIPSIHTQVALHSGELIWLHCLHPAPPSPIGADTSTQRDTELLIVGKEVQQKERPVITLRRLPAFGSDHFPVYIVLSLVPQAKNFQEEPQLEADEAEEVQEKINHVK